MREIKFNAVDEETAEYVRFDDFIKSLKEPNGFGYIEFRDDDTQNELLAKFLLYYHGYKLLQYTGIKDRNGVEIYEGDLVRYKDYDDYIYEVVFIDSECKFLARGVTKTQSENDLGYRINNKLKVIGNIYEDKQLLNNKKENTIWKKKN